MYACTSIHHRLIPKILIQMNVMTILHQRAHRTQSVMVHEYLVRTASEPGIQRL